jgi:hypothetical protein
MSAAHTWFGRSIARAAIREHLVTGRRLGRPRLGTERRDPHLTHQPLCAAVDRQPLLAQHQRQTPRAQEGELRKQLVDPAHQPEIVVIGARGRR